MQEIFESFFESAERLKEVLAKKKTIERRDSAIKRFELTVELAWKSIQACLREKGVACRSPKECLQGAFSVGLLQDDPQWIQMIDDRNETVHTYDEEFADEVYERLPQYLKPFRALEKSLRAMLKVKNLGTS